MALPALAASVEGFLSTETLKGTSTVTMKGKVVVSAAQAGHELGVSRCGSAALQWWRFFGCLRTV